MTEKQTTVAPCRLEQFVQPCIDSFIQGDNCKVMRLMPDECIDLVVTSPPYDDMRTYGGHSWDFYGVAWNLKRILKPGGVIVWVVADQTKNGNETGTSMKQALFFQELGLNLHDTMIYQVPGTGAKGSNLAYWQVWEYMFVFSKGQPKTVNRLQDKKNKKAGTVSTSAAKQHATGTRLHPEGGTVIGEYGYRDNVWVIPSGNNGDDATDHPAPFPEQLAADHIASWSNEGDLVLDPFSGSGTTCKKAKEMKRHWIGIEIESSYIGMSEERTRQEILL